MTHRIDRRSLLLTGTLGLGAFAIPGFAAAFAGMGQGFTHSVASGEPGPDRMLLWTRYVPASGDSARVRAEISETADFARIAGGGQAITGPWRDWTVKIAVTGLLPGRRYFYRFVGPDGSISPIGRTRTLPNSTRRFTLAVFSCSNMGFGWFNAYAHAAARGDIDLGIHVGDYIYEYGPGVYPSAARQLTGRMPQPEHEILALADYRLRYASYRSDPDLQALHAAIPMLIQWDDHETANNSWEGGAQNHQANEGDWSVRRAAAIQAWHEWMPVSETPWAAYDIGGLATLFRTESRLLGRTRSADIAPLFLASDPARALAEFRDGPWQDAAASMLGSEQEAWLSRAIAASVRSGRKWQVTAFGTILGQLRAPADAVDWLLPDGDKYTRAYVQGSVAAGKAGLPVDLDNWGGYPAARARFLKSAQAADANLLVLCGDSHNAWAFDLAQDGHAAGVEFAGHSVTSPGYEDALGPDFRRIEAGMAAANPELKWCDVSRRGYMALTLTPERATNHWLFVDTVLTRNPAASIGHTATVKRGSNRMA
ncbi:alkaline phosphatase D family protein [Sphingomonas canadensis]|uniref:Alkaline phosphatase D family protein n=1 Tax=Sphingomonas canadensis TaxID=1219257 RepID=A0ABW3H8F6_9SPHN|nr:alkaline phosphatase D family protein [Sphingomonas canadensis]MCW3837193.1 alkaline phosphatase D family protein [Sphingomonas canadensis]